MPGYSENKAFLSAVINDLLLDEAVDWIQKNLEPEDVFTDKQLASWAVNNGYAEAE